MRVSDFRAALQNGRKFSAVFTYGECEFYLNMLQEEYFTAAGVEEVESFYFDEYSFENAKSFLSQPSLFSPTNALLIKTDKKLKPADAKALFEICEKNEGAFVFIQYFKPQNKEEWVFNQDAKKIETALKSFKDAVAMRVFNPFPDEAIRLLHGLAQKKGLEIERERLYSLYNAQNQNLTLAAAELQKQILHEIHEQSYSLGSVKLDDIFEAILFKKEFSDLLARAMEEGYQPIEVVMSAQNRMREIFNFFAYIRSFGHLDKKEITGFASYPEALARKNGDLAMRLNEDKIREVFLVLAECSLSIKENRGEPYANLLSSLMKIKALV